MLACTPSWLARVLGCAVQRQSDLAQAVAVAVAVPGEYLIKQRPAVAHHALQQMTRAHAKSPLTCSAAASSAALAASAALLAAFRAASRNGCAASASRAAQYANLAPVAPCAGGAGMIRECPSARMAWSLGKAWQVQHMHGFLADPVAAAVGSFAVQTVSCMLDCNAGEEGFLATQSPVSMSARQVAGICCAML